MASRSCIRYADVAVTFTANEFQGIYRSKKYHESDFSEVLSRARDAGCSKILLTTMTLNGARQNLQVCRDNPGMCYMTLGIHPYHVHDIYKNEGHLEQLTELGLSLMEEENSPLVAFGEIGLDYDYLDRADKETQQRAFRDQLELAVRFQLPLFLHARASFADFVDIIAPYLSRLPRGGLIHSFAGTQTELTQLLELGLDVSVNGVSFRTPELLDMVRNIPMERLQIETDAPWCEIPANSPAMEFVKEGRSALPASRKHGKFVLGQMVKGRNEPCTIGRVAAVVAGVKGISTEEVANAAWRNSIKMFGLGEMQADQSDHCWWRQQR